MPCNNQEKRSSHLLEDSLPIIFWRGFPLLEKDKTSDVLCFTQDIRLFIVTLIVKLLRVWMGVY
jgi:hypothetical protein